MHWSDDGIVLGARKHGESGVILELMTRAHGRHLGLVHGGRSRCCSRCCSRATRSTRPGGRGSTSISAPTSRGRRNARRPVHRRRRRRSTALPRSPRCCACCPSATRIRRSTRFSTVLVDHLDDPDLAPALFVRFELEILAELGFGLDLPLRRDREPRRPRLRLAEERARGQRCGRRALQGPAPDAAGLPRRPSLREPARGRGHRGRLRA